MVKGLIPFLMTARNMAFHVTSGYHDEDFPTLDAFMETIEADPYSLPFEGAVLLRGCRVVQEEKMEDFLR
jgi:hypothetical protein